MRRSVTLLAGTLLIVSGVTACGDAGGADSTAAGAPAAPSTEAADLPGEPWDVLFLADTTDPLITETIAESYRQAAEDAAGVEARLLATGPLYPQVKNVLEWVRGEGYPDLSEMVPEAEVIVVQTWPKGTISRSEFNNCFDFVPGIPDVSAFQSEEYWAGYREALGAIYNEIWRLRARAPTVVIGIDVPNAFVAQQTEEGITAECRALFDEFSEVQREVAETHGAKWVSIYDAVNGPNHDLDAVELGLLGPSQQTPAIPFYVANEAGSAIIADALAAAGFEPTSP